MPNIDTINDKVNQKENQENINLSQNFNLKATTRKLNSSHDQPEQDKLTTHQRIHKMRMLSPENKNRNIKIYGKSVTNGRHIRKGNTFVEKESKKLDENSLISVDPDELKAMKDIHLILISKVNSLVSDCKNARYGGFFSPRKLKKRLIVGKLSNIPISPKVVKCEPLSPLLMTKECEVDQNVIPVNKSFKCGRPRPRCSDKLPSCKYSQYDHKLEVDL